MPELPEVEIVCQNLNEMFGQNAVIDAWTFYRSDLRFKIPQKKLLDLKAQKILGVSRRAKFILIDIGENVIVSHLGMTGAWRQVSSSGWVRGPHDHVVLSLKNKGQFVYSDPRRFGFIEVFKKSELTNRFKDYGVEPLSKSTDFKQITSLFKQLNTPIKSTLMNQKLVVGIGNIYASEILFRAGVSPLKKCSRVSDESYLRIWEHTQKILLEAIKKGGSTIENYRNSFGQKGDFQNSFYVYDREKLPCLICHSLIKQKVMSGRSTFWCSKCQK